jgi:PAS domain-containing protein
VAVHERTFIVVLKRVFSPDQVLTSVDTQLAIIDATPDFIGYCNRDGELLFLNPAAKMLLGIKSQEQFDRITLFELFAPVMRRSFATTIFPSLSKKGRYIGNGLVNGKFRKSIPVSVVMNGLSDEEGNLNTITFILRETQREITSPTL